MAALIDGEDTEGLAQRRQNPAIGEGVEAVGVEEQEVARPTGRAGFEDGDGALAAPGQRDEATREGGNRRDGLFLRARALAGGQLDERGDAVGGIGGLTQHPQRRGAWLDRGHHLVGGVLG